MNTESIFSSNCHTWETPQELFDLLDREFKFDLDVCALPETAKCARFFTPQDDGLSQRWDGVCWMNPPYGRQLPIWMEKAATEARRGATVVCLVPARVETAWWWKYALIGEVRFLRGRVKFVGGKSGAPFPSAIVIYRPGLPKRSTITTYWDWRAAIDLG